MTDEQELLAKFLEFADADYVPNSLFDRARALLASKPAVAMSDLPGLSEGYRRGIKDAFHHINMMNVSRLGRTPDETCTWIVRTFAEWVNSGEVSTVPAQPCGEDAATVSHFRYIVIGYGEADHPQAAFVNGREQILDAVLGMMYMSPSDADDEIREAYRTNLDNPDEWSGNIWRAEFEIGGIVIYCLGEAAPLPAEKVAQAEPKP